MSKKLFTSQRQAVIKLSEEKDKRLLSNSRPTALLSIDYKMISKLLCFQIEKSISKSYFISTNCICCTKRCINESGRLISDLLGYLVTSDIEKASNFLISTPKKFGFDKT